MKESLSRQEPNNPYAEAWRRARKFWNVAASNSPRTRESLEVLNRFHVPIDCPGVFGGQPAQPNILVQLSGEQRVAETFINPYLPSGPQYGAMPYFQAGKAAVYDFAQEAAQIGLVKTANNVSDKMKAEGILLFRLKFRKKLSQYVEEIVQQYRVRTDTRGRLVNIFGLSGSGKSTAIEGIQEHYGEKVVIIDSDTARYHLFAAMIKEAEATVGKTVQDIQEQSLMHNAISGALYALIGGVSMQLVERGYMVIKSSSMPDPDARLNVYIEHPDGIDPSRVTDTEIPAVAQTLFQRTEDRVRGADDYDWEHARIITDFRQMTPVTVRVPVSIHAAFLKKRRQDLTNPRIQRFANPFYADPHVRKEEMKKGLSRLIDRAS